MPKMQKKPAVYLLVILPIFVIGGISVVIGLETTYARMAGVSLSSVPSLNGFLISLPALFLWVPVALLLANCVLFVVPPLRKVAETYAAEAKRPGFLESQRKLGRLALIMALICIPLIMLGFML
jgi:hypothetical protein